MSEKKYFLGFCIGIGALGLILLSYCIVYAKRIYPNTYVGKESVGGLGKQEAKDKLQKVVEESNIEKVVLAFEEQKWEIIPSEINLEYNVGATVEEVWQLGRRESFWLSFADQLLAPFRKKENDFAFAYDQDKLDAKIKDIAGKIDIEPKIITFELKNSQVVLNPSKEGQKTNQDEIKKDLFSALSNFQKEISLNVNKVAPKVTEENAGEAKEKFTKIVSDDLILKWNDKKYIVKREDLQYFVKTIEVERDDVFALGLDVNTDKIKEYLNNISKDIERDPQDAKLTIVNGQVSVFQISQDGYKIDQDKTIAKIKDELLGSSGLRNDISLEVETIKPKITGNTISEIGIKELVGEGKTSWKGSPKNRIHNLTLGASKISGTIVKPGEEFSAVKTIGQVGPSTGFLQELVIKNSTQVVPEYGGGLCQVSTTLFRAAIYSGLKITARTPHSFRVSYYEPPVGMDATIYSPAPDFKFINDMSTPILIWAVPGNNSLVFQIYGTKDGRQINISSPVLSNYTSPPAPVYTQSNTLAPGEKKQVERATPGYTASFTYKVTDASGKVLENQTFISKYVALPNSYYVGPPSSAPAPAPEPTPAPVVPPEPPVEQPPADDSNL